MVGRNLAPSVLDEHTAAFIQGGVSMIACSRTHENVPVMSRVLGCRVSSDRRTITVLLARPGAQEFLDEILATGQIAVVFSLPSTHQTIQLKGEDATVGLPQKRDVQIAEKYQDAFVANLVPFGYEEAMIRAFLSFDRENLSAVSFTPSKAFLQTPGPRAGEPLKHAHTG
jgi:hypothetical protein